MSPIFNYVAGAALALLGVRLLLQSIRNRQLPEGLLGLYLVLGPAGMGVAYYAITAYRAGDVSAYSLVTSGTAVWNVGILAYYGFIWRTFRPTGPWGALLCGGGAVALLLSWYWVIWQQAYGIQLDPHPVGFAPRLFVYAWGIYETTRMYRMVARRRRLGLADPVVVNRMFLFVLWNIALLAPMIANALLRRFHPASVATLYQIMPWILGLGLALITVLVFFPPAAYTRYLRQGYEEGGGGEP